MISKNPINELILKYNASKEEVLNRIAKEKFLPKPYYFYCVFKNGIEYWYSNVFFICGFKETVNYEYPPNFNTEMVTVKAVLKVEIINTEPNNE